MALTKLKASNLSTDADEHVDDRIAALIVGGNNITATYNDAAGTLTIDGQPGYADSDVATYLSGNGYATSTSIIADITASAPSTLDTLNELAAALGDDPNFATTVTNSIALKAPLASPAFTGGIDVTGTVVADGLTVAGTVLFTGGGVQFPTQLSNSFTPNAQRADLLFASNPTSNNAFRIGSIASNAGVTLQGTRQNDSALKVDLVLQPDGGNVGIGKSDPARTLDVHGSVNISVNTASHETFVFTTQAADDAKLLMQNASADTAVQLSANGTTHFNGGNVGIGTTSPTSKLEIKGASSTNYLQFNNSSDSELFRIDSNFNWAWGTTTPTQAFDMRDNSGNALFSVDRANGKVGIGTTSPNQKFEVEGGRSFFSANNENFAIGFRYSPSHAAMYIGGTNSVSAPSIQFSNAGGGPLVNITYDGNVGIGTDDPGAIGKLVAYNASSNIEVAAVTGGSGYATYRLQTSGRRYSMQIRSDQANAWTVRDETSGSNQILVNTAGGVSMPNQPHSYGTFGSDNLSTDTGWTMSPISTVALTYTNNASHGWGMTVEQAGYYQMTGMGLYNPSAGASYVYIGWCVNGVVTYHWHNNHTIESNHDFVSSAIRYCNVGDHITMENRNSRTLASQWGGTHSQYHIYKLG